MIIITARVCACVYVILILNYLICFFMRLAFPSQRDGGGAPGRATLLRSPHHMPALLDRDGVFDRKIVYVLLERCSRSRSLPTVFVLKTVFDLIKVYIWCGPFDAMPHTVKSQFEAFLGSSSPNTE